MLFPLLGVHYSKEWTTIKNDNGLIVETLQVLNIIKSSIKIQLEGGLKVQRVKRVFRGIKLEDLIKLKQKVDEETGFKFEIVKRLRHDTTLERMWGYVSVIVLHEKNPLRIKRENIIRNGFVNVSKKEIIQL